MEHSPLAGVRKLSEYRAQRTHVFPSDNAMQWFVRNHKAALIEAGALVMLTGQWHAVDEKFDAYVVQAGQRAAQARSKVAAA